MSEKCEELRPCPFCGSDAETMYVSDYDFAIKCKKCGAQSKTFNYHNGDINMLVKQAWNTRVADHDWQEKYDAVVKKNIELNNKLDRAIGVLGKC